jgi:DNA-directed RNA polymerase
VDIMEISRTINQHAHTISELIGNANPATIAAICGLSTTEAQAVQALSTFLHNVSHAINRSINGVIDILSCQSFNPIYTIFVHNGTLTICSS